MIIVVAGVCWGTSFAIDIYTHHGESVAIPNIKQKSFADAEHILADAGLSVVVSDTGYVKSLPPDCILEQSPAAGSHVKTGHVIYVIVNASRSPEISLPDIIDNSSLREAMAKLTAMGFKLTQPQFVPGEKDWVVGVVAGLIIPVIITVYSDKSFTFILKTPPAAVLIKKALGIQTASGTPNKVKVGKLTDAQLTEIAQTKLEDLNAYDIDAAKKIIAGTARSMGVEVEK